MVQVNVVALMAEEVSEICKTKGERDGTRNKVADTRKVLGAIC